jgi:hypothetical protein
MGIHRSISYLRRKGTNERGKFHKNRGDSENSRTERQVTTILQQYFLLCLTNGLIIMFLVTFSFVILATSAVSRQASRSSVKLRVNLVNITF